MRRILYLSCVELQYRAADIKGMAVADGYNVITIKPLCSEAHFKMGDKHIWNGEHFDFWLVEAE